MRITVQDLITHARSQIKEIGGNELLQLKSSGCPIVDVREPAEFAAGHIPGAVNIPRGVLEFEIDGHPAVNGVKDPALAHRDQPIALYCRSGGRSALAAEALKRLGFADPLSLAGGYNGWTQEQRAVQA
jgi:rhodanese-related sulfurtransferase